MYLGFPCTQIYTQNWAGLEKLLTGMPSGKAPSRNESGSAAQDGNSLKVSSMSRCNKKQRLAYKKRQKAKKAQNK